MTTNKPEVFYATNLYSSAPVACLMRRTGEKAEPVIRLSDYEALQAECEKLRRDAERYQWLKPHLYVVDTYSGKGISYEVGIDGAEVPDIDDVTEAIDAAMQADNPC